MHWHIFEDGKVESVKKGDVNFPKKSNCNEKFAQKVDGKQTSEYIMNNAFFLKQDL